MTIPSGNLQKEKGYQAPGGWVSHWNGGQNEHFVCVCDHQLRSSYSRDGEELGQSDMASMN